MLDGIFLVQMAVCIKCQHLRILFPHYNKKSISSAPVSMLTTLLLESASWCRFFQPEDNSAEMFDCYDINVISLLHVSCFLKNHLVEQREKDVRSPEHAVLTAGVGGGRSKTSLKDSRHQLRGLLGSGSHPQDPQRIVLGKPFQPHASQELREPGVNSSLLPCLPAASWWGSLVKQWQASGAETRSEEGVI